MYKLYCINSTILNRRTSVAAKGIKKSLGACCRIYVDRKCSHWDKSPADSTDKYLLTCQWCQLTKALAYFCIIGSLTMSVGHSSLNNSTDTYGLMLKTWNLVHNLVNYGQLASDAITSTPVNLDGWNFSCRLLRHTGTHTLHSWSLKSTTDGHFSQLWSVSFRCHNFNTCLVMYILVKQHIKDLSTIVIHLFIHFGW